MTDLHKYFIPLSGFFINSKNNDIKTKIILILIIRLFIFFALTIFLWKNYIDRFFMFSIVLITIIEIYTINKNNN